MAPLLNHGVFLLLSIVMYAIFAEGLLSLGTKHQAARVHRTGEVGQFPEGYFTMLAIQLLPLAITGLLIGDVYIFGTRIVTLIVVLLVYGMVTSPDGTFNSLRYRLWFGFWVGAAMLLSFIWSQSPLLQKFVEDYETWIAWSSVVIMVLFVAKGQLAVMKALFHHFVLGNYTVKRFNLQVVRFFGFLFQAIHYGFVPSGAKPFVVFGLYFDPIFLQGAIGTLGVGMVIVGALYGMMQGSAARKAQKRKDREQRLTHALAAT